MRISGTVQAVFLGWGGTKTLSSVTAWVKSAWRLSEAESEPVVNLVFTVVNSPA